MTSFQRARKPEQKDLRRNTLLDTARELAREVGPMALGLNELGRRSGITKSNIYRYFESREHVLLQLLVSELEEAVVDLEDGLPHCRCDVRALAVCISKAYLQRPLLCQLLGMVAAILEHNLSQEAIAASKHRINTLSARLADALARANPPMALGEAAWLAHSISLYVAGLWPAANPSPTAAAVLAQPEFQALRPHADRDLQRMIEVLILGLESSRKLSG